MTGYRCAPWSRVITLLLIAVLGFLTLILGGLAGRSPNRYRSPFAHPLPWGNAGEPVTERVVLCVVDGLRDDTSREVAEFNALRNEGADFQLTLTEPTTSTPVAHVIAAGATQQTIGLLSTYYVDREWYDNVGTIYSAAKQAGLKSGNMVTWHREYALESLLDAPNTLRVSKNARAKDSDAPLLPALVPFLRERPDVQFVWVHFSHVDQTGHVAGADSQAYRDSVQKSGERIAEIAAAMDLERETLVVTSDHGHIGEGGHWGGEPELTTVPGILLGAGIRSGTQGNAKLIDLASTVTTLLGAPVPTHSQGWPLFDALELSGPLRARRGSDVAAQRLAAYRARVADLGLHDEKLDPAATDGLSTASIEAELEQGNWDLAFTEASDLSRELSSRWPIFLAQARERFERPRRWAGAGLALLGFAMFVFVARRFRFVSFPPAWLVTAVAATAILPLVIYWVTGHHLTMTWVSRHQWHRFIPGRLIEGAIGLALGYALAHALRARFGDRSQYDTTPGAVLAPLLTGVALVVAGCGYVYLIFRGLRPQPWHISFDAVAFAITAALHFAPMATMALVAAVAVAVQRVWQRRRQPVLEPSLKSTRTA